MYDSLPGKFCMHIAAIYQQTNKGVIQTFMNMMNERLQRQATVSNPFKFEFIKSLKSINAFHDTGPCVVMASPGMLQVRTLSMS